MRMLAFLLLLFSASFSYAQSTAATISARLKNKPLYLRGFWGDKILHFNADGQLIGDSKPVSFTLSGFELKKIDLKQDGLFLEGQRLGLALGDNPLKLLRLHLPIQIEIDASPTGDYSHALDAIFATNLSELVPALPVYWRDYAVKHFLPSAEAAPPSPPQPQVPKAFKIDSSITPPILIYSVKPERPEWAHKVRYGGQSIIKIWVTSEGNTSHFSIVEPVGMGLDEDALAAVMKYKFKPATQNGNPVVVEVNIAVDFDFN